MKGCILVHASENGAWELPAMGILFGPLLLIHSPHPEPDGDQVEETVVEAPRKKRKQRPNEANGFANTLGFIIN